jgi:flagellar hook-length control protein FliK
VAAPAKLLVGDEGQEVGALQAQVKSSAGDKTGAKTKALPVAEQGAGRAAPDSSRIQESRFMATLEAMRGLQGGSPAEPAPNASPLATLLGEKPTAERGRLQERTPEGGFGVQPSTLGTTSYASPAVQDGGAVSPEMYVAQEVSYWISQDVQNAELRLDGLGLEAVDVSITMHGNEAHVAFRTDELQARTMLEGAAAHLKEALQGEGLVLAGVSVGTSGARDNGDNERKQRHGARQTESVPVSLERPEAGRPRGGTAGRTLDLFV